MTDAYVYDHVRSPRGRGRANGSLHEVTPVDLTAQVLSHLRDRNELDTSRLDDVVLGCVSPVGEQGSVIARTALLNADYAENVPGKQLNRYPDACFREEYLQKVQLHNPQDQSPFRTPSAMVPKQPDYPECACHNHKAT